MPLLGIFSSAKPPAGSAVTARTQYELKDFVGDQQGVDDMTTSTLTMLHNSDTVTLVNPFEGVTAHFSVKTVVARSELELTGWKAQPSKTYLEDVALKTGETKSYSLSEGTDYSPETGFLPEKINRDIYITLTRVDLPGGETQYTGAGQSIFGAGGYWNPQNIIKRVRGRRMIVGESRPGVLGLGVLLTPAERSEMAELTKEGEVISPRQLAMVRGAYLFEGVKDVARPPVDGSERPSVGVVGRFRSY